MDVLQVFVFGAFLPHGRSHLALRPYAYYPSQRTLFWIFGHVSEACIVASILLSAILYPTAATPLFVFLNWCCHLQTYCLAFVLMLRLQALLDILCTL